MQEIYDGEPVAFYRAKFNGVRFTMDPEWAAGETQIGKLPIVLVACRIGKPVYDDDKDGDRFKEVTFRVEEVVPMTGELRKQAMIYMAHEGEDGVIDFPTNPDSLRLQQALRQQDRLLEYITKEWGGEVGEGETPVEAAIRLLEEYRGAEAPSDGSDIDPELAEFLEDEIVPGESIPPAPALSAEQAVAVASQSAAPVKSIVPPIPPEEPSTRRSSLKTAGFDPNDVDGFEVRHPEPSDPSVEVIGSVYRPDHADDMHELLEKVF